MHDIELSGTNPFTVNFRASAEWYARIFYEQGDTTRWLNVTPLSGSPNITSVTIMPNRPTTPAATAMPMWR